MFGLTRVRMVGFLCLAVFVFLQMGIWDSPDMDIYGASVPAWLMAIVFYLLGAGAGWAAVRQQNAR